MKVIKRVSPKSFQHKEKFISFSFLLYLYEIMDVHKTYCDDHFMMYISQIMVLHSLNLYSNVHQLYINKTGKKTKKI